MRRAVIVLLPVAALLFAAGCGEWREYSSSFGKFRVLMPGIPRTHKQTEVIAGHLVTLHIYVVYRGEDQYQVVYNDLAEPKGFNFDKGIRHMAEQWGGKAVSQKKIEVHGHEGREFEVQMHDREKGRAACRVVLAGNRLYQVVAKGPNVRASSEDVQEFLQSFEPLVTRR